MVGQNLWPTVQDRYKFSSDMKTFDSLQDKLIFNEKKYRKS